jgi:pyrimidine-nucleoside phosphorylase
MLWMNSFALVGIWSRVEAFSMRPGAVIQTKRDGGALSPDQIDAFVAAAARPEGSGWESYHLSALLMAIYLNGMMPEESALLTRSMADSGTRLDLSDLDGPKVDKHSTGGVGDKTSLVAGPLAAACGVLVPMMAGRGLGHSGGTLDKLESIPGFNINLREAELRNALRSVGLAMFGQTKEIAPADKTLYALRDVTATVESIPLIAASILSKKLAEGISGLVMDVKTGRGAFMQSLTQSRALAESLVSVGTANGLTITAIITAMDAPLGNYVGNAVEVIEAIETLKGNGSSDLIELSVLLAARMVQLAGIAPCADAEAKVRAALTSGAGLELFRRCIEQQGGNPRVIDDYNLLPTTSVSACVRATRTGFVAGIDAKNVGEAVRTLGGGRSRAADQIDPSVGVRVVGKPGDSVSRNDVILEIHAREQARAAAVMPLLESAITLSDQRPPHAPLILEEIG